MEKPTFKWSDGKGSLMELEQAKEELEVIEDQYPHQYEYLKQELRFFILELQSKHQDSQQVQHNTSIAWLDTEESTNLEEMKRNNHNYVTTELGLPDRAEMQGKVAESPELEPPKAEVKENCSSKKNKRKNRVDLVLERAQNCLKKLQQFKASLLSPS